jgi:hypothetical protein
VENHPFGWICHLSGWKEVLEKSFKHMKGYFLVLQNNHHDIKAALPIYEVRSWFTGNRLVSIPFATLCDPLISTEDDLKILFDEALILLKERRASYIEIQTFLSSPLLHHHRLNPYHAFKHHYLLLDNEPEQLKKSFHRTCVRQRITRAMESNLTIKFGSSESDLNIFYRLHLITRKRLGLPPQPYRYFFMIWKNFFPRKRLLLLLAEKQGNAIGGLILLKFKDRVSAEFAASDEKYQDMSPNHLLFWEAIKWAYSEGYKVFDFGRTALSNITLMEFKNRWGTKSVDLPKFFYPPQAVQRNEVEKSKGYQFIRKICESAPDWALPSIGRFCYRHLG